MIYEVEVSEQADSDLRGIFEYIAFELQSPENEADSLTVWKNRYEVWIRCRSVIENMKKNRGKAVDFVYYQ